MCLGPHKDESCGWPKGTVRATIAVIVIILSIAAMSTLMILFFTSEKYEAALGIAGTIAGIMSIVIGYYFGAKSAEGAAQLMATTEERLLEVQKQRNMELLIQDDRYSRNNQRSRQKKRRRRPNSDIELEEIVIEP